MNDEWSSWLCVHVSVDACETEPASMHASRIWGGPSVHMQQLGEVLTLLV